MATQGPVRPVDEELWVVETPLRFLGMQLGRRMSVVRLMGQELLIHSPAQLTAELRVALDQLGTVRFVVPAGNLHGHLFMEQYREACPAALLFAAPGLERRRRELRFDGHLGDAPDPHWADDIDQALFRGPQLGAEVLFHHCRTRTLIAGDVLWNVTASMALAPRLWAGWRARVTPTPAFRLAIRGRAAAAAAIDRILTWNFDRILVGHGEIVHRDGHEAFARAYRRLA